MNLGIYENPTETPVPVGQDPEAVAVTPNGSQAWVADTGPQTGGSSGGSSLGAISVVSTATDKVVSTLSLPNVDPRAIAFSPSGATAYVTTGRGLYVIATATVTVTDVIKGLGDPRGRRGLPGRRRGLRDEHRPERGGRHQRRV